MARRCISTKKPKACLKAAPEETLKQALAAIERKKQQDAQIEAWAAELQQGGLPAEISADLKTILHAPDKQNARLIKPSPKQPMP